MDSGVKKYKDALTCPLMAFSSYLFTGKILQKILFEMPLAL